MGDKLLEISIGRGFGDLKGFISFFPIRRRINEKIKKNLLAVSLVGASAKMAL